MMKPVVVLAFLCGSFAAAAEEYSGVVRYMAHHDGQPRAIVEIDGGLPAHGRIYRGLAGPVQCDGVCPSQGTRALVKVQRTGNKEIYSVVLRAAE